MNQSAGAKPCPPELCLVRPSVVDSHEVIRALAARAHAHGYVKDSFEAAILAREQDHPTGLPTALPAAIPHADPEHVRKPGFGAALLDPPVNFHEMGNPDGTVAVQIVVMLLVTDPAHQVKLLGRIIQSLQDNSLGARFTSVGTPLELSKIVTGIVTG